MTRAKANLGHYTQTLTQQFQGEVGKPGISEKSKRFKPLETLFLIFYSLEVAVLGPLDPP